MTYRVSRNGQTLGSYTPDEIQRNLSQGWLLPTDSAWSSESPQWVLLSDLVTAPPFVTAPVSPVGIGFSPSGGMPESEKIAPADSEPLEPEAVFVGPKYESYFEDRWERIEYRRSKVSWNWAAFFFGIYWVAYRKMYRYAWMLLSVLALAILADAIWPGNHWTSICSLVLGINLAMIGNQMYRQWASKRVESIIDDEPQQRQLIELAKQGGTSIAAAISLFVASVAIGPAIDFSVDQARPFLSSFLSGFQGGFNRGYGTVQQPQQPPDNPKSGPLKAEADSSDAIAPPVFGPWQSTSGVSARGTQFCAIGSIAMTSQNIYVKGFKSRDSITVDLYNNAWAYPAGKEVLVSLNLNEDDSGYQQTFAARGDGKILDLEIPLANIGEFLTDLANRPALRVAFHDNREPGWTIADPQSHDTVFQFLECLDSASPNGGDPRSFLAYAETLDQVCRGGNGPEVQKACKSRDTSKQKLKELGYCYGKEGELASKYEWHHCGPGSLR